MIKKQIIGLEEAAKLIFLRLYVVIRENVFQEKERKDYRKKVYGEVDFMKVKKEKPCKRKNCPYYNIYYEKCSDCELNPNSLWTTYKKKI